MKKHLSFICAMSLMLLLSVHSLRAQNSWSLSGNNTNNGQAILGTLSQQPLRFYTAGTQCGIFSHKNGFLGVGTNAPKNPLHIHSGYTRGHYAEFNFEDPELPPIRENGERSSNSSFFSRNTSSITSSDYSGLQITNAATGAESNKGLLLYIHGQQGFLRQQENNLLTIGVQDLNIMNFTPQGNVGIGTEEPTQMLHVVNGNILISKTSSVGNRAPGSTNGSLLFGSDIDNNTQYGNWGIEYMNDASLGYGLNFWQPSGQNQNVHNYRLFLADDGNVGIGTSNPQEKLSVNGTVLAKAVRVNTDATYWPDYVFGSDYKMMTLAELENYVNEHRHLPGIPSATEVEEQGSLDLGAMNTLLLQKVEELTRYVIDLQKQIDELKKGKEE